MCRIAIATNEFQFMHSWGGGDNVSGGIQVDSLINDLSIIGSITVIKKITNSNNITPALRPNKSGLYIYYYGLSPYPENGTLGVQGIRNNLTYSTIYCQIGSPRAASSVDERNYVYLPD